MFAKSFSKSLLIVMIQKAASFQDLKLSVQFEKTFLDLFSKSNTKVEHRA